MLVGAGCLYFETIVSSKLLSELTRNLKIIIAFIFYNLF